jgi:Ca2+:H+ antiporter
MPRWLYALLVFAVLTALFELLHVPLPPLLLFLVAALGIIPLAALIGQAVEQIAEHTGERIGGLLFATFGNATELIIGVFALRDGLVDVVRASIIGSILGNALLVLGVATFIGSVRAGRLRFETRPASQYASLLALCVGGLVLPTFAELLASHAGQPQSQITQNGVLLSDFIAIMLLLGYLASLLFSVFRLGDGRGDAESDEFDPVLGERSTAAIMRLLDYRRHIERSEHPGRSGMLRHIDTVIAGMMGHELQDRQGGQAVPTASNESAAASREPATVGGEQSAATSQAPEPAASSARENPAGGLSSAQSALAQTPAGRDAATVKQFPLMPKKALAAEEKKPPLIPALLLLAGATVAVGWLSDILVGTIEPLTVALHWNPAFVGLVFVPLIGGLPEYFNTISMALEKRMGMVLAASAGSSIQIALLMAPILVLVSLAAPVRLDLVFSIVELAVLGLATFLFSEITRDGELVWLEGLLLILLYAMMAGTVFIFGA